MHLSPCCWLQFKAVQPVKEILQHVQRVFFTGLHLIQHVCQRIPHPWITPDVEVPPLERDGVVNLELPRACENPWESGLGEVTGQGVRDVGEHEGSVLRLASIDIIGEDSGQSGERVGQVTGVARDGTIGEDENGGDGIGVILDLGRNTLLEFVVLSIALVGEPWCVENANLGSGLCPLARLETSRAHRSAVPSRKLVAADLVGLFLLARTTFFAAILDDIQVVVIKFSSEKGIGDELDE